MYTVDRFIEHQLHNNIVHMVYVGNFSIADIWTYEINVINMVKPVMISNLTMFVTFINICFVNVKLRSKHKIILYTHYFLKEAICL